MLCWLCYPGFWATRQEGGPALEHKPSQEKVNLLDSAGWLELVLLLVDVAEKPFIVKL